MYTFQAKDLSATFKHYEEKDLGVNDTGSGKIGTREFRWNPQSGGLVLEMQNLALTGGPLRRFLRMVSFPLDEIKGLIEAFSTILDVDKTDADYLPLASALLGIDFSFGIPIPRQREEIKGAVEGYKTKGTIPAIKRFCRNTIGIEPEIVEWPPQILTLNDFNKVLPRITTPGTMDNLGFPGDQAFYLLDFSEGGDYRFDKFGIYFQLAEYAGISRPEIEKIMRLLPKNVPASTVGKITFVDAVYQIGTSESYQQTLYHVFGTGEASWDEEPPQSYPNQAALFNEVYRRKPDSVVYLDANNQISVTPTTKVRVVSILKENELDVQYIREHGLFGGDGTSEKDSGLLLGAANHKGQWKGVDYRIRKTMELSYGLAFIVDENDNYLVDENSNNIVG